jgi:hypothetical protein
MELHLKITGIVMILLALAHVVFPAYFNWKQELSSLSTINRQMMFVHTFFIAVVLLLMGILCLSSSQELVKTPFGKRIALGMGIFWLLRLLVQFFWYSSTTWKGKKFETIIHIVFSILWTYMSFLFISVYAY